MSSIEHPRIRRLGADDLGAMHGLLDLFAHVFADHESYSSARPDAAYLARLMADSTFFAIVAEVDGTVIGGLAAYELRKFEQARSEIYLYDLGVLEAWRRKGIATGLIDALRAEAARIGAWVIFVQADYVDPPAIALYEKLGTREEVLHFDIAPR
jgi:aminoglycoside 3-N-acetyltransferase I